MPSHKPMTDAEYEATLDEHALYRRRMYQEWPEIKRLQEARTERAAKLKELGERALALVLKLERSASDGCCPSCEWEGPEHNSTPPCELAVFIAEVAKLRAAP